MDKRFQIFVSSTYEDLYDERQEVIQALLELNCIPSGMELFPAANEDQWTLIKKVIDDCDYYLDVIAGRYGSTGKDDLSYTQMEYEYAISKGKPTIAFLHKNPGLISVSKTEKTAAGRKKLEKFRQLAEKKVVKHWPSPQQLGSVVKSSIVQLIASNPAVGWIRADGLQKGEAMLLDQVRGLEKIRLLLEDRSREVEHLRRQLADQQRLNAAKDSELKVLGSRWDEADAKLATTRKLMAEGEGRIVHLTEQLTESRQDVAVLTERLREAEHRIAALSRNPYSEDKQRCVTQLLDQMTYQGWLVLRSLLMHEPAEQGRPLMDEIPIGTQNEQLAIALRSGVVRSDTKRQGGMSWNYLVINREFRFLLEKVLYERLEAHRQ